MDERGSYSQLIVASPHKLNRFGQTVGDVSSESFSVFRRHMNPNITNANAPLFYALSSGYPYQLPHLIPTEVAQRVASDLRALGWQAKVLPAEWP